MFSVIDIASICVNLLESHDMIILARYDVELPLFNVY